MQFIKKETYQEMFEICCLFFVDSQQLASVRVHCGRTAPRRYTACTGVPQYLCHRSMALVTMASVFS